MDFHPGDIVGQAGSVLVMRNVDSAVEVGIDETGDGTIDDKLTSYADRKYTLAVKEIGSEGRVQARAATSAEALARALI